MKVNFYPSWDLFLPSCGITINGCLVGEILNMEIPPKPWVSNGVNTEMVIHDLDDSGVPPL